MAELTSTELGASGRYISFNAAALDVLGSQTIIAYCRPTGSGGGGFGYIYGKTPTGSTSGPRFFIDHNAGSPRLSFGASSTSAGNPNNLGASAGITYNAWQFCEVTWDGALNATGISLFVNGTAKDGTRTNGTGSITSDAANDAFLMNRFGLGREFVGDIAWLAVWDRVLSADERASARAYGPLTVQTGLVLAWANQADLGPLALSATTRSSYVAGALPPNVNLDGIVSVGGSAVFTGYAPTVDQPVGGAINLTAQAGAAVFTGYAPTIDQVEYTIRSDYERASVTVSGSSISGAGDSAIISLQPRFQETEAVPTNPRWLEPSARIDGVNGKRPTFRFLSYASGANGYHGHPWQAGRRPMFSYDRLTWTDFDTAVTLTGGVVEFRHSAAFAANTVYISRSRQISVAQVGDWLATMSSSYSFFVPAASAVAYTPTGSVSGFAAQTFIADEYSTQTDSDGNTVPVTPFYAAEINDTSLMPADGSAKRIAFVFGGNHAGEDHGEFVMRAFLGHLCGGSADAQALRRQYRVIVYPMLNAPGRAGGGWRGSYTQGTAGADDINRNFDDTGTALEVVDIPKATITSDRGGVVPDWVIDFHGTYVNTWAVFVDLGDTMQADFQSRLQTNSGQTVADEGESNAGAVATYFKVLGSDLTLTHESGTPAPVSDASITTHGGAITVSLASMMTDGLLFKLPLTAGGAAAVLAVGYAPTVDQPRALTAGAGAASFVGYAPSIDQPLAGSYTAGLGAASFSGYAPSIDQPRSLIAGGGSAAYVGYAGTLDQNVGITAGAGAALFTGYSPTVEQPRALTAGGGSAAYLGYSPGISQVFPTSTGTPGYVARATARSFVAVWRSR